MCHGLELMASSSAGADSPAAGGVDAWAPPSRVVCESVPARAASIAAPAVLSSPAEAEVQDHYGRRLVFYNTDAELGDDDLRAVFAAHGEVASLSTVRNTAGQSCGCGHVTFASAEGAAAALAALQGSNQGAEAGCTLGLLLVEAAPPGCSSPTLSALSAAAAAARGEPHKMSRTVFFTKVPPMVTSDQLLQLFAAVGEVVQLELFIPWPGAKISKGCGLVEYNLPASAAAAVHSLKHRFTWPHSHSALVVEWVDRSRQSVNSKADKAAARAAAAAAAAGAGVGAPNRMFHHPQFMPGSEMVSTRMLHQQQLQQQQHGGYGVVPQGMLVQHQGMQAGVGPGVRSCPLPQLPPGWQVLGTTQSLPPAAALLHPQQQQYHAQQQQPQLVQPAMGYVPAFAQQHYHQPPGAPAWASDTSNALTHVSVPASAVQSGSVGGSSAFELTALAQASSGSSSSSASMLHVLSSGAAGAGGSVWDPQQAKLVPASIAAGVLTSSSVPMQQVPEAAPLAGTRAHDGGVWQQLLQQNVMLLQTMTGPAEEDLAASLQQQCSLMPQAGAAVPSSAALLQSAAMQQHPSVSGAMAVAPTPQLVLQQPLTTQPQQEVSVALPLSQRQVAAIASVLPELPRLTGAQAYISPQMAGGLALVLSGTSAQLQAAYATAGILLSQCGVTEALALPLPLA